MILRIKTIPFVYFKSFPWGRLFILKKEKDYIG
jgi:hypothetical protein